MNRTLIICLGVWTAGAFGAGWAWRGDRAEAATATRDTADAQAGQQAEASARTTEHQQAAAAQVADSNATTREEQIDADYKERMAAAVAGRDSELGRLRKQWAGCETARLSEAAGAAAEAAAEDRLRRAGAAGIVRATELAQSERDQCLDRYQTIQ